ncbi:MAG: helix-turn-helix transcriptional regulator [Mycobacteriales bacterium]
MVRRRAGMLLPLEVSVLEAGLAAGGEFHGFEVAKSMQGASGAQRLTAHGTLYKALARLEAARLVRSRWEDPAPEGRPRRRLYTVTGQGEHALAVAHRAAHAPSTSAPRPGLAT